MPACDSVSVSILLCIYLEAQVLGHMVDSNSDTVLCTQEKPPPKKGPSQSIKILILDFPNQTVSGSLEIRGEQLRS